MSTEGTGSGLQGVYRTLPARIVGWALVGAVLVGGLLTVQAEVELGRSVLLPLAVCATVLSVVWVVLLRPLVELHTDKVVLRNLVRDVEVPFAALAEVGHQWALELTDTAGRRHSAWAVPKQREYSARRRSDDFAETTARRRGRPGTTALVVADDVQRVWQRWRLGGEPGVGAGSDPVVSQRWALSALAPLGLSLAFLLLVLAFG